MTDALHILTWIMLLNVLFYIFNIIISYSTMRKVKALKSEFDTIKLRQGEIENTLKIEFKKLIDHLKR